jgi:UDP-N-acetylmuramate dehydrogenase
MTTVSMPRPAHPADVAILPNAPIPTWFGIGGGAERFATPTTAESLARCIEIDPAVRILGDGANLLVDDDGVTELVVSLKCPAFTSTVMQEGRPSVTAGAGADLPRLILDTARLGLAGLEGLGGIPATVGGATIMNAGGSFGQIADRITRVHGVDRNGRRVTLARDQIDFSYRHSGLTHLVITSVDFDLVPDDPAAVRARLKDVMAFKKGSQPMAENSAGCAFKNVTLDRDFAAVRANGERVEIPVGKRVPAGLLIDVAGCKGVRVGGASVSPVHANFIVTDETATARDVIMLMNEVSRRIHAAFGIALEREVVVWSRHR